MRALLATAVALAAALPGASALAAVPVDIQFEQGLAALGLDRE